MKKLALFVAIALCMRCTKKSTPVEDESLQGQWLVTDQYTGNGGGTETHQTIAYVYYTFTSTDSLYMRNYDVEVGTKLSEVTSSSYVMDITPGIVTYKITGNKMEIRERCDEGCRFLLTKVK